MSDDIILGGWIGGEGQKRQYIGIIRNPSKEDIHRVLEEVKGRLAVIGMEYKNGSNSDNASLEMRAENGRYLVTLGETDADGYYRVRSLTNANPKEGDDFIDGEFFGAGNIVEDFDLVLRAFCEFAETGNVSHDLMD